MDTPQASAALPGGDVDASLAPTPHDPLVALNQLNERALAFVRERPIPCVLGALALGYVVGKIAQRY